ncbi:hypothetical protein B7P43_G15996 [Cryptotermes secundus]|uniref:Uncharacterized protein n=1 Tax=Cryptotermes secundus TaxID=105785 RepID=A0A2J7PFH6_9NEOP|nr:hypothetical protein B7P43_G15996 [Cryptotermes secundus]
MEAYGGVEVQIHIFLTSELVEGEWSAPWYPLDRRLRGPQSRSGERGVERKLAPTLTRTPTPRSSSS